MLYLPYICNFFVIGYIAPIAQWLERFLSKEEVPGSNPGGSFLVKCMKTYIFLTINYFLR